MPEMPAWAARLLLYIVVGAAVVLGLPLVAWVGRREVARWEERVDALEAENSDLKREVRKMQVEIRKLRRQGGQEHEDLGAKMDRLIEELSAK